MPWRPFLIAAAIAALAAGPASALGLLSDAREVFSSDRQHTHGATPAPPFSAFTPAVSARGGNGASQDSWLDDGHFAGQGSAWSRDPRAGFAYSHFGVRFVTGTARPYALRGELENGWVRLERDPLDDGRVHFSQNGAGASAFASDGWLPPGEYGLTVSAQVFPADAPQAAHWHFEFRLAEPPGPPGAAVPEPGSGLLLGAGLLLLGGARVRAPRAG